MSARTSLRVLTEALLAGDQLDLGSAGAAKWLPEVDDQGVFQLGSTDSAYTLTIYLGSAANYAQFNPSDDKLYLKGVDLNTTGTITAIAVTPTSFNYLGSTLTVPTTNTVNTNSTNTVADTFLFTSFGQPPSWAGVDAIQCNTLTANGAGVSDVLDTTNTTVLNAFAIDSGTFNTATVNGLTSTKTGLVLPSADDTGTATIGNSTRGMDFRVNMGSSYFEVNRGARIAYFRGVVLNTNAATYVGANLVTTAGNTTFAACNATTVGCDSITVEPTADDTGTVTIGTTTEGIDVIWFGGSATHKVVFDRGVSKLLMNTIPIDSNAAVTVNSTITSNGAITASAVNAAAVGNFVPVVNAQALTVIPGTDDTGLVKLGDGATPKDLDLKIFLGGASQYAEFNRGDGKLYLKDVPLETNAAVVVNAAVNTNTQATAGALQVGAFNQTGIMRYTGNGRWSNKNVNLTANTVLNATHYNGVIRNEGAAGAITHTLPAPTGLAGVSFEVIREDNQDVTLKTAAGDQMYFKYPPKAAMFTRANDEYLYLSGATQMSSVGSGTYGGWMWCNSAQTTNLIAFNEAASTDAWVIWWHQPTGTLRHGVQGDVGVGTTSTVLNIADNTARFIVGTVTAGTGRRCFINGTSTVATNNTNAGNVSTFDQHVVGKNGGSASSSPLNGRWASTFAYNTVLSNANIDWLYNSARGRDLEEVETLGDANNPGTTNLKSWHRLDQTGSTWEDSYGSYDLTDNNTVGLGPGKTYNQTIKDKVLLNTIGQHITVTSMGDYWAVCQHGGTQLKPA